MNQRILIVDCFDSFTFNLVHLIEKVFDETPTVIRVDECTMSDLDSSKAIVFSPGPGLPSESNNLLDLVKYACAHKPVLGVCLGHQAIAQSFGGELIQLPFVYHGIARKANVLEHSSMYTGFDAYFDAASYHSWTVNTENLPPELILTAIDDGGEVLSFCHKSMPIWGVQFHPESVLCVKGFDLIVNWKNMLLANNVKFV
jgi:anthranilate synthase component 2